jgi:hypothetical protein
LKEEPQLGILEKVDLRDPWPREDTNFTPWLAKEENLKILSECIGMDLEWVETEARVGPFKADIICKETATDSLVLIENQLECTDHIHLGQLMTYAAGLDTVHIIWIAKSFNDEHRAALDWLNRITMEGFHFFGVEIELWKIGDSLPAPKFNVVCKPNDWQKSVKTGKEIVQSERSAMFKKLWSTFLDYMKPRFPDLSYPKPAGSPWIRFKMESTHANLSYAPSKKTLYLYLLFKGDDSENWFKFSKENLKSSPIFEWVDHPDGPYATWGIDYVYDESEKDSAIFEQVGRLLSEIQKEIKVTRQKYLET